MSEGQLCRAIWVEPFRESANAIEICKLHTDQPEFPQAVRGTRDTDRTGQPDKKTGQPDKKTGQPDKKTGQPDKRPDKTKIPLNPKVYKLINAMRKAPDRDKVEIAREIADGDGTEAESLLRQARRFPDLCR